MAALENVVSFHMWGKVVYWLRKAAVNTFNLEESGPTTFDVKFSFALKKFYDAIPYVSRNTTRCRSELKLTDSIELAAPCVKLFSSMQKAKEELYPTRTSFIHVDGMPWTTTIKCLISTWNSWKALQKRLEFFNQNLVTQVDPHTITNESLIEHGWGSKISWPR